MVLVVSYFGTLCASWWFRGFVSMDCSLAVLLGFGVPGVGGFCLLVVV